MPVAEAKLNMPNPLDNIGSGILGMYAAIKIFRHNGIDPHAMVDAIIAENPCWKISPAEAKELLCRESPLASTNSNGDPAF
jgi:hypothetical protein